MLMAEHYYTIKDIEEMTGIPATAIRFYDKRGLLVFVKRSPNGMRIFTDRDVEKIRLIQLLRNLDMPVNVISRYIGLVQQGDASRPERRRMIASHIAVICVLCRRQSKRRNTSRQRLLIKMQYYPPEKFWAA